MALAQYTGVMSRPMKSLAMASLQGGALDPEKARKFIAKIFKDSRRIVEKNDRKGAGTLQGPRLLATELDDLGAAYKYRYLYPDLDFQKAVRNDVGETLKSLKTSPKALRDPVQ